MNTKALNTLSTKQLYARLPLVYACSGCSSAAQLANDLAVRLDHQQKAEMSCIAGVGGDVKSLLRKAKSGRKIMVLDGCPLHCALMALARHGVHASIHLDLSLFGVKKRYHEKASQQESKQVWEQHVLPMLSGLSSV